MRRTPSDIHLRSNFQFKTTKILYCSSTDALVDGYCTYYVQKTLSVHKKIRITCCFWHHPNIYYWCFQCSNVKCSWKLAIRENVFVVFSVFDLQLVQTEVCILWSSSDKELCGLPRLTLSHNIWLSSRPEKMKNSPGLSGNHWDW